MSDIRELVKAMADEDLCDALADMVCMRMGMMSGGIHTNNYQRKHAFISEYLRRLLGAR